MNLSTRWWLFSWNKPPIPMTELESHSPKMIIDNYHPPSALVMPYLYDSGKETWFRWACIAGKWIAESYYPLGAPCKKNAVELLLLKG